MILLIARLRGASREWANAGEERGGAGLSFVVCCMFYEKSQITNLK